VRVRSLRGSPSYVTYVPASRVRAKAATLGCTWPPRQVSSHQQDRSPPLNSGCLQHPSTYQSINQSVNQAVRQSVRQPLNESSSGCLQHQPSNQSACQSVLKPVAFWLPATSVNQSASLSVALSVTESVNVSASQSFVPVSQPHMSTKIVLPFNTVC